MESIVSRINKLLALGERGGTEAEATAAMRKVHELLAKHNLSLDDVKESPVAKEDYIQDESDGKRGQPWQDYIWTAIAKLYFCKHLTKRSASGTRHLVIGKPSNIAVVKYLATYLVRTGDALAREAAAGSESGQTFRNSFKKGFAYRIATRVEEEIVNARAGAMTDSSSGTALMLAPLYDQTKRDIDRFLMENRMRVRRATGSIKVGSPEGFAAGHKAGNSVSLSSNGVSGKAAAAITKQ